MQLTDHFKIQCRCEKCGRTQVRRISDLLSEPKCRLGPLGKTCDGTISYHSDDLESATCNAVNLLNYINWTLAKTAPEPLRKLIDTTCDDVSTWGEGEQSPREMGWVGANGLP